MIAPRVMWSAFESECGTISDAQLSLTVVYDTYKLVNCTRSHMGAQEALGSGRNTAHTVQVP